MSPSAECRSTGQTLQAPGLIVVLITSSARACPFLWCLCQNGPTTDPLGPNLVATNPRNRPLRKRSVLAGTVEAGAKRDLVLAMCAISGPADVESRLVSQQWPIRTLFTDQFGFVCPLLWCVRNACSIH
jgi:hypothetical protein